MAARKLKTETAASASAHPWSINVGGVPVPLIPTIDALLGIEAVTRKTIYAHLIAASGRAVTIADLTTILRFLAGPASPVDELAPPLRILEEYTRLPAEALAAQAIVIRTGMMEVLAATMLPLLAASKGQTDENGALIRIN